MMKQLRQILTGLGILALTACLTTPPKQTNNICAIFKNKPQWFWRATNIEKKWGVPIELQMAIIHQESDFVANAKPPRHYIAGVIPWFRSSDAYGYSQALTMTWKNYKDHTGRYYASRSNFSDALDFVGWYIEQAHRKAGISKKDPYHLYLAYHEGIGGFERKTYLKKPWLIQVSQKVALRASRYHQQLRRCEHTLSQPPWYYRWRSY